MGGELILERLSSSVFSQTVRSSSRRVKMSPRRGNGNSTFVWTDRTTSVQWVVEPVVSESTHSLGSVLVVSMGRSGRLSLSPRYYFFTNHGDSKTLTTREITPLPIDCDIDNSLFLPPVSTSCDCLFLPSTQDFHIHLSLPKTGPVLTIGSHYILGFRVMTLSQENLTTDYPTSPFKFI